MPTHILRRLFRVLLVSLACCWVALAAQAQSEPVKFGQIDKKDLTAEPFVADSAAEAVVLCDYGTASMVTDGRIRFDHITRIKILKKSGLDWANGEIQLYHDKASSLEGRTEQLTNLQGNTYNLVNGQVEKQPMDSKSAFPAKKRELSLVQKFALPNVRVGSVIEYSYTIFSDYIVSFRSWQFQRSIPTRWSEFRASIPLRYTYKIFLQSQQTLAVDEHTAEKTLLPHFRWAMREVPALRPEPFMTSLSDYVNELSFELATVNGTNVTGTWEQIDHVILKEWEVGQQLASSGFLKADVARLSASADVPTRLAAVRALVLGAVKCTGTTTLRSTMPLHKIYQETHLGTAAETNMLLIMALREAGFAANPVMLSTRAHGRLRANLPQLAQFNYVAAYVQLPDGKDLVLDATDPLLPYDMLPDRCLNQKGRLVSEKAGVSRWLELKPRYRRLHLQQVQLQLAPDGSLRGQVHEEFGGYASAQKRADLQELGDKKFTGRVATDFPGWSLSAVAVANRDSVQKPLVLDYAIALPASAAPSTTLYLSPLQTFGHERNPFPSVTRLFPVDFGYAREETLVVTLTLPPSYGLAEMPKVKTVDLPDNGGRFVCSATATGATVQLTSRLVLRKPVYTAAEYGQLRELLRLVIEKQAEKLVIKKQS